MKQSENDTETTFTVSLRIQDTSASCKTDYVFEAISVINVDKNY